MSSKEKRKQKKMEFVGEDLAALDAALAFLDEWDIDAMEDGLNTLHMAASAAAPSPDDKSREPGDQQQHAALRRMLEPEPFAAGGDNMTLPMTTGIVNGAIDGTAISVATADSDATTSAAMKSELPLLVAPDDALISTETCPVEVDDKPRCKKKRQDDAATTPTSTAVTVPQDPRALALQSVNLRVKRRRQKEELLELRQKVQQLETRLSQIKANGPADVSSSSSTDTVSNTDTLTLSSSGSCGKNQDGTLEKPRGAAIQHRSPLGLIWERLAARQLKERKRAEEENQRLKEMLDEHVKLARSLDRILRKRATAQARHSHDIATNVYQCPRY